MGGEVVGVVGVGDGANIGVRSESVVGVVESLEVTEEESVA